MKDEGVIYTVKKAEFDVDGQKYDMSNVVLTIPHNGIPYCTVWIAPADGTGNIIVNALNVVSLKEAFDELSRKAIELAKSNLVVEIESTMAGGIGNGTQSGLDQTLEIKNWLLKEVGLSQLTTTSPFTLACRIYHPAIELTLRTGFYFDSSTTLNFEKKCMEVRNPLQAAQKTIETLQEANKEGIKTLCTNVPTSTKLKMPDEINNTLKKAIEKVKAQLDPDSSTGLLKWDPSFSGGTYNLPMEGTLSGTRYEKGLKYALCQAWMPTDKQGSAWTALQNVVMPWFALELADTWDKPTLSVVPVMPWKRPTYVIEDFMVSAIELPGKDPNPIYGCILFEGTSEPTNGIITFAKAAPEGIAIQPANLAFVPEKADDSVGSLLHVGKPEWIDLAASKAGAFEPVTVTATGEVTFSPETRQPIPTGSGDNKDLSIWNSVKMQHLANTFMGSYRSGVTASMVCAFMVKNMGETIIPGKVGSFVTEGNALFSGMITLIEHGINCARSTAYTKINMNYCQSPDSSDNVLGSNPLCPYYNALASAVT